MYQRTSVIEELRIFKLQQEAKEISDQIAELQYLITHDRISHKAAILDDIAQMEENRRQLLYQIHPYKISPRTDVYGGNQTQRNGWMTRVLIDGKLQRRYAVTREALEERLLEHYGIIDAASGNKSRSLAGLYDDWIRYRIDSRVSLNTVKRDQATWKKYYLGEKITQKSLNTIKVSEITSWFSELIDRCSLTKREYLRIRGLWKSIESFALADERIAKATLNHVPVPRADAFRQESTHTKENAALSFEELHAFEEMAGLLYSRSHFNTSYLGLILNLSCGMRAGELSCLRWDGIDHDSRTITLSFEEIVHLEKKDDKLVNRGYQIVNHLKAGHKLRIIPLTEEAEQILEFIRSENEKHGITSEWVFAQKNGERVHTRAFQKSVKRIYKELGITNKTGGVHTLRRTYATALIDAHLDEKNVQSWMGHTDFRTTKRYYDMPESIPKPSAAADVSRAIWGKKPKNMGTRGDNSFEI